MTADEPTRDLADRDSGSIVGAGVGPPPIRAGFVPEQTLAAIGRAGFRSQVLRACREPVARGLEPIGRGLGIVVERAAALPELAAARRAFLRGLVHPGWRGPVRGRRSSATGGAPGRRER